MDEGWPRLVRVATQELHQKGALPPGPQHPLHHHTPHHLCGGGDVAAAQRSLEAQPGARSQLLQVSCKGLQVGCLGSIVPACCWGLARPGRLHLLLRRRLHSSPPLEVHLLQAWQSGSQALPRLSRHLSTHFGGATATPLPLGRRLLRSGGIAVGAGGGNIAAGAAPHCLADVRLQRHQLRLCRCNLLLLGLAEEEQEVANRVVVNSHHCTTQGGLWSGHCSLSCGGLLLLLRCRLLLSRRRLRWLLSGGQAPVRQLLQLAEGVCEARPQHAVHAGPCCGVGLQQAAHQILQRLSSARSVGTAQHRRQHAAAGGAQLLQPLLLGAAGEEQVCRGGVGRKERG